MRKLSCLLLLIILSSCGVTKMSKTPSYQLKLIDEYVIPAKTYFDGYEIGGLSGIDFRNDTLVLIDDRSSKPLIYTAEWKASNRKIDSIVFINSIHLKQSDNVFTNKALDLEGIRFGKNKDYWLSSEGNIRGEKDPLIFQIDEQGKFLMQMKLPAYFQVGGNNQPIHNGVFEGLTWDIQQKQIWAATELPLKNDGRKPQLWNTFSPVRFTAFDADTGEAKEQFIYQLDRITRLPLLPFYINGVTEILSLTKDEFLVIERAFSAGRGKRSNRIKLFIADFSQTSNTLNREEINKKGGFQPAYKELLLDFKKIRKQLPSKRIDNIEGLCYGPTLPNGNKSLLFVSDNNFNSFGEQINQFIWMELIEL